MEPYIANARVSRREALLRRRLEERVMACCIPQLLPDVGGDMAQAQQLLTRQIDAIQTGEPGLLNRSTEFLCSVITDRCKILIRQEEERQRDEAAKRQENLLAVQPSESEILRRRMRDEILSRFERLKSSLKQEDRDESGALPASTIRLLCRRYNVESGTLDDILASCYLDNRGGGRIQYLDIVDRIIAQDYPELLEPDTTGGITSQSEYGRSHLRRRMDGPAGTMTIRALPTDEWAALSKSNIEVANAYEEQMAESKRRERHQYGQEIRRLAMWKKQEEATAKKERKRKEREAEDRKMQEYLKNQADLQEAAAQRELAAWQEGQVAIQAKRRSVEEAKRKEIEDAKTQLRRMEKEDEEAFLAQIRKTERERAEWKATQAHNKIEQAKKQQQVLREREEDKARMKLYAEMLEKEHKDRMAALNKALNYKPPESNIRAAEGIREKALADEQRALQYQRLQEVESLERDLIKEAKRKQDAKDNAQFLLMQMKQREEAREKEKYNDKMLAERAIEEVKDSLRAEEEAQERRRNERIRLAAQQREQALLKEQSRSMTSSMSPREKRLNRDLFDQLSNNNRTYNSFTQTARRVFS